MRTAARSRLVRALLAVSVVGTGVLAFAPAAGASGPGNLDTSFNGTGIATTSIGGVDAANAVVVQPDGKTVAAGTVQASFGGVTHFGVVRYNVNGTLDTSFGGSGGPGKVVTPPFYGPADGSGSNGDAARAVALDANNKIVVAGDASDNNALGALAVARYNTNGTLDTSFGSGGQAKVRVSDGSYNMGEGMTIEPNGKIVVVGIWAGGWAVSRFTSAGVLDTTFNPSGSQPGVQEFSLGDSFFDDAYAVTTEVVGGQTDIVVGGTGAHNSSGGDGAGNEDFAVVRFTDTGAFDSTFGTNGVVRTDFGGNIDQLSSILVQPNGKILAVGQAADTSSSPSASVAFARYNPDGTPDTSFNSTGKLTSVSALAAPMGATESLGLLADGSIVAAATALSGSGDVELEKLTSTGHPDTTFGTFGVTTTNVAQDQANALAVDPTNGRVVVAGSDRSDASHESFEVERYTDVAAPSIATNPTAQNACGSGSATFTVAPTATSPYTVQWQVSTNGGASFADLPNGSGVSGATTTSLHLTGLTSADNGKQFRAVINDGGGTATSNAATLTAGTAPSVTTNPTSQTRSDGAPVSFTAAASGDPAATVQWSVSTNGGTSYTPIGGATATTYSTTAALASNGNKYEATFTNGCGSATTTPATLTVTAVTTHELVVSQFRLAGGSTGDWYVDIRNTTAGVVNTTGWKASIETAAGTETPVALPVGTIPANGSVLLTGTGYSLSAYAAADGTSAHHAAARRRGGAARAERHRHRPRRHGRLRRRRPRRDGAHHAEPVRRATGLHPHGQWHRADRHRQQRGRLHAGGHRCGHQHPLRRCRLRRARTAGPRRAGAQHQQRGRHARGARGVGEHRAEPGGDRVDDGHEPGAHQQDRCHRASAAAAHHVDHDDRQHHRQPGPAPGAE